MPLFIDTYNVLHTTGVLPPELAGIDLEALLTLIARSRYKSQKITLFCDGTSKGKKRLSLAKTISLKFSGPHRKADDLIVELLDKSSHSRRITVVTSDRAIIKAAKTRRCSTITSQLFLQHLANDAQTQFNPQSPSQARSHKPLDDKAIKQWINEFELGENELNRPTAREIAPTSVPKDHPEKKKKKAAAKPKHSSSKSKNLDVSPALPTHIIEEAEDMLDIEDQ